MSNDINKIKNYLRVVLTPDCNLSCYYCHREGASSRKNIFKKQDFINVLDAANEMGFEKVKFTGGEPLKSPYVFDLIEYSDKLFNDVSITTNGTMIPYLSNNELEKLSKARVNISINTLKPSRYRKTTKTNYHNDAINGLKIIKNISKTKINSVITTRNKDEMEDLINFSEKNGVTLKFLDLVNYPSEFISLDDIESILIKNDFKKLGSNSEFFEYSKGNAKIQLSDRLYANSCKNCDYYKCSEGISFIRVFYDGLTTTCFNSRKNYIQPNSSVKYIKENLQKAREEIDEKCLSV